MYAARAMCQPSSQPVSITPGMSLTGTQKVTCLGPILPAQPPGLHQTALLTTEKKRPQKKRPRALSMWRLLWIQVTRRRNQEEEPPLPPGAMVLNPLLVTLTIVGQWIVLTHLTSEGSEAERGDMMACHTAVRMTPAF